MPVSNVATDHMKRIFTEGFSVGDVAEPLVSFDATTSSDDVLDVMARRGFEVVGVRTSGAIAGYIRREDLVGGPCGDYLRSFQPGEILPETAGFPDAVRLLSRLPRLFVIGFGRVGGIVTRSDLQKPPVRMWLFGMITIIEMGLMRLIEARYPDGGWQQHVSQGRLDKAQTLLEERKRRNQELDLLDCLQFSDKGQITLRDEVLRSQVGYRSRSKGEETIKSLEALRNNLAHSQDIVTCDWDTIVQLTENMDVVFSPRAPE